MLGLSRVRPLNHRFSVTLRVPRAIFGFMTRWPVLPATIIAVLVMTAIFAPVLSPADPLRTSLSSRNVPPSWSGEWRTSHLLGTDPVGRDVLSRVIHGARTALIVASVSAAVGISVGTVLGMFAGFIRGHIDELIMRVVDVWSSLPYLLVALVVVVVYGRSFAILIGLLALLAWPGAVRLVRAETLTLRTRDYVALARVAGASTPGILYRHILPGVISIVAVAVSLNMGTIILVEASLSFLGAGIPPPTPSWGSMVAEGRQYLGTAWWVSLFPGIAIGLVVMAANFFGDWLRDRLDPRLRQL